MKKQTSIYYAIDRTNTRTGAKHATIYADTREQADARISQWCLAQWGNVATLRQLPDAQAATIGAYQWNADTQRVEGLAA